MRPTLMAWLMTMFIVAGVPSAALMLAAAPSVPAAAQPPMIVAAWNYAPDASVSPVRQAVQAYLDFRDFSDGWKEKWSKRRVVFHVDGVPATSERAVARLLELPVLTWAHPYHCSHIEGGPAAFSPESIDAHKQLVADARLALRSAGLSEHRCDRLFHVVDFEAFNSYAKPPLVPGAAYAVQTDHASTACHLFGQALQACSWDTRDTAGAANYHTCHAADPFVAGGLPNNRATPPHVPASMDGRTVFVSLYTSGGTWGCLTEAEGLDAIAKAPAGSWLVIDDHQPGRANLIRSAKASGRVRLLLLWGTVKESVADGKHRDKVPAGDPKAPDKGWQKSTDSAIARELRAE